MRHGMLKAMPYLARFNIAKAEIVSLDRAPAWWIRFGVRCSISFPVSLMRAISI
jgi:hypothetical protein